VGSVVEKVVGSGFVQWQFCDCMIFFVVSRLRGRW
jgi:hypothetical protein